VTTTTPPDDAQPTTTAGPSLRDLNAEMDLIERDADMFGFANQIAAGWSTRLHYTVGVPAIVFGTIAGTAALAEASPVVAGAAALASAALSGIQTFVGTERRAARQRESAAAYFELRDETRRFRKLDFAGLTPARRRERLQELADRLADLNRSGPAIVTKDLGKVRKESQELAARVARLVEQDRALGPADIATQLGVPVERVDYMLRAPAVRRVLEPGASPSGEWE
jgi:hypothetical protein